MSFTLMHQLTHPVYLPSRNVSNKPLSSSSLYKKTSTQFIIEPKADLNYAVVSAASIVAKVYRDKGLEQTPAQGSGYPSDPKTRNWLKDIIRSKQTFPRVYDSAGAPLKI